MGIRFMGKPILAAATFSVAAVVACTEDDGGAVDAGSSDGGANGGGGSTAGGSVTGGSAAGGWAAGGSAAGGSAAGGASGDEACCTLQQCAQDANGSAPRWQVCQTYYCDPNEADDCDALITACLESTCSLTPPDPATCDQVGAQCNQDFICCAGTEYCDLDNAACAPLAQCSRLGSQCSSDDDCCPQPAEPGAYEYCGGDGSCEFVDSQ